jgi:hypothetical protein
MTPFVGATGIRTRNLVLFKDVVPSAFVTKFTVKWRQELTRILARPSGPNGRGLNPLVANVFPSAFAIKFQKQRDNRVQDSC